MGKFLAAMSGPITGAVWFLLFVILGTALDTALIAAGCVFAAGALATGMASAASTRAVLDAPLTSAGMLLGIATFAILEIVLSVPMWIGVISGLGVVGLYGLANAVFRPPARAAAGGTGGGHLDAKSIFAGQLIERLLRDVMTMTVVAMAARSLTCRPVWREPVPTHARVRGPRARRARAPPRSGLSGRARGTPGGLGRTG
jgi:hypothetical protein